MMNKTYLILLIFVLILTLAGCNIMNPGEPQSPPSDAGSDSMNDAGQALPIPALLEDTNPEPGRAEYTLRVQSGTTQIIGEQPTPTLGYNGSYLGPAIKLTKGEEVQMHVTNELGEATSVHWHGLEVEGTEDGGPHQVIAAGETWNPSFTVNQPAATLWFHPHVIGTTAIQVYYGLAGLLLIEDENSKSLGLPDDYGVNDIPLVLQDRSFNQDGSFLYVTNMMDGAFGDYILVNGAIAPNLEVSQVKMRFRVVNGANARNFNLELADRSTYHQIASDGGLLEAPVLTESLFISPGERAEIIVDFSKYDEGEVVELISDNALVMTFRIGGASEDITVVPKRLADIERLDERLAIGTKSIELDGMGHMVTLNGRKFDMHRIDDNVTLGDIEIWEITTTGAMMMGSPGHPFHIHGTQFQILSRSGKAPGANERGWKDTVFVRANETVRIIVRFNYEGVFMYHCHILEHEEAGMMGQLEVVNPFVN